MAVDSEQKSLYERIYPISAVVDDFIDRIMKDPRLNANPRVEDAHHKVTVTGFKYLVDRNAGIGYTDPALGIGVLPLDRSGVDVVFADVGHELVGEIVDRGEDALRCDLALKLAEPEFDLVEPAGTLDESALRAWKC